MLTILAVACLQRLAMFWTCSHLASTWLWGYALAAAVTNIMCHGVIIAPIFDGVYPDMLNFNQQLRQ